MSNDRTPPNSPESELAVLGAILLEGQRVLDLCAEHRVDASCFYAPANRTVFAAAMRVANRGHYVDAVTVTRELDDAGEYLPIGGTAALEAMVDACVSVGHVESYLADLADKARAREVIAQCQATQEAAYTASDGDALLSAHAAAIGAIEGRRAREEVGWPDVVQSVLADAEAARELRRPATGLNTGFSDLDRILCGMQPGNLYILAARPSVGKTSLAMNIAENVAAGRGAHNREGVQVGIFELEMDAASLARRMVACRSGVNATRIKAGQISEEQAAKVAEAGDALRKLPLHCDTDGGLDIRQLRFRARRWRDRRNIGLLIVDHLNLLHDAATARQGRQIETAAISGQLKEAAKELAIPVLALCQLSRAPERGGRNGRPRLSDLRDSGAIEQDADVVMLLSRPCKIEGDPQASDKTLVVCDIGKNRNGSTTAVELTFEEEYTRFSSRARGVESPLLARDMGGV